MSELTDKARAIDIVDRTVQDKIEAKAKKLREKELGDIRKVLSEPEGRRFYWRVLSKCGVFRSSWTGDVNQTLVNEGSRVIGTLLLDDLLEASPGAFAQMQREFKSKSKEE